jgi:hypothetical protein
VPLPLLSLVLVVGRYWLLVLMVLRVLVGLGGTGVGSGCGVVSVVPVVACCCFSVLALWLLMSDPPVRLRVLLVERVPTPVDTVNRKKALSVLWPYS